MTNLEQEHKKEHLIAVEDVMRQVRLLAGWGQYPEFIADPGTVFDTYNDMSIEELHEEQERLSALCTKYVSVLHPVGESSPTIFRELSEDEQDSED